MGTNYYAVMPTCDKCGRGGERIHIGKNSMGWRFLFHATETIGTHVEMRAWLLGKEIRDEYGAKVEYDDFWAMVEKKQSIKREDEPRIDARPPGALYDGEYEVGGYRFDTNEFS